MHPIKEDGPLQIIRLGGAEENYSFSLEEDNLSHVLDQIPEGQKVAVVSVVGAFRTGKSFLLSFLLRYLKFSESHSMLEGEQKESNDEDDPLSEEWMQYGGDCLVEGNENDFSVNPSYGVDGYDKRFQTSFKWRAGSDRMTTGIWVWSKPFFRKLANNEEIAIILMDTQGMFDNETSITLTACIFGLSTLVSSYQIYNVQNRIQEDNLGHLAMFAEYGRIALQGDQSKANSRGNSPLKSMVNQKESEENEEKTITVNDTLDRTQDIQRSSSSTSSHSTEDLQKIPFQTIEFLVRDWTDLDEDDTIEDHRRKMDEYLAKVIRKGNFQDLAQTREHIQSCFEKVKCFTLCHPGTEITKKNYNGDINKIDPLFRKLLNNYARGLFSEQLEPKKINGFYLTALELKEYVKSYVSMFKDGNTFPKPQTMLEVTAEANCRGAKEVSFSKYKREMNKYIGVEVTQYRKPEDVSAYNEAAKKAAIELFDQKANIGRKAMISEFRKELIESMEEAYEQYNTMNKQRNPFQNLEYYVIPLSIAFFAFIIRSIADSGVCTLEYKNYCKSVSNGMGHIYIMIFTFFAIASAGRMVELYNQIQLMVAPLIKQQMQSK